jgi:hypothetical protein
VNEKCRDPCEGSCGLYAKCFVNNHVPVCLCPDGFTGDPFRQCNPKPLEGTIVIVQLIIIMYTKSIHKTIITKMKL